MIIKDLNSYADTHWKVFLQPITCLSQNSKRVSLVVSDSPMYDFDAITKTLYPKGKCPSSADCLNISNKEIEIIEFKTGFKKKITRDNRDPRKAMCDIAGIVCEEYWDIFFDNQKRKTRELFTSIRFKAIESYLTLEKHIFPRCNDVRPINIKLTIVIDEDGNDSMESTLAELSGKSSCISENCFEEIKGSLSRIVGQQDTFGNAYLYDSVEVLSAYDFLHRIMTSA